MACMEPRPLLRSGRAVHAICLPNFCLRYSHIYSQLNLKLSTPVQEFFCNPRSSEPPRTNVCARFDVTPECWKIVSRGGRFWVQLTINDKRVASLLLMLIGSANILQYYGNTNFT